MRDTFSLRYASLADAAAISRLELRSAQHEARLYPLPPYPELCAIWRQRLSDNSYVTILAESADVLVGFAALQQPLHAGYLMALYIAPEHFRRGVGAVLMHAAEEVSRQAGAPKIQLEVEVRNLRGQAFYRALGFEESGVSSAAHLLAYAKTLAKISAELT